MSDRLPTMALFAPLSPQKTGVAEYTEALLPYIAQSYRITIITSGTYRPSRDTLSLCKRLGIECRSYDSFKIDYDRYDIVAYQLGNSAQAHGYMYDAIHRYPGIVFLHDLTLYHGVFHNCLQSDSSDEFVEEMRYASGLAGKTAAERALKGGPESADRHPLVERILDDALAVVVFNSYMMERVLAVSPGLHCAWIPLHTTGPVGFPARFDAHQFRASLGLGQTPLVATLGLYNPHNRIHLALKAFRMLLDDIPDAIYLLVGEPPFKEKLKEQIAALGVSDQVRFTGWLSAIEFEKYVRIPDVAIQLRYPHAGGTSYNPIRLAAWGVPSIISRIGPMQDIPGDVMSAIEPNTPDEVEQVYRALRELMLDHDKRNAMSRRAREYVHAFHSPETVAERLTSFVNAAHAQRTALQALQAKRYCPQASSVGTQALLTECAASALSSMGVISTTAPWITSLADTIVDMSGAGNEDTRGM